jgi:hypothetical protein
MSSDDPSIEFGYSSATGSFYSARKYFTGADMVAAGIHTFDIEDFSVMFGSHVTASISEVKVEGPEPGMIASHTGLANFEILSVAAQESVLTVKMRHDHPRQLPFQITYFVFNP